MIIAGINNRTVLLYCNVNTLVVQLVSFDIIINIPYNFLYQVYA